MTTSAAKLRLSAQGGLSAASGLREVFHCNALKSRMLYMICKFVVIMFNVVYRMKLTFLKSALFQIKWQDDLS